MSIHSTPAAVWRRQVWWRYGCCLAFIWTAQAASRTTHHHCWPATATVRQLLLIRVTQELRKQQEGRPPAAAGSKSSASRRQQPVSAYHRNLLCVLGMAEEVQAQVSSASWGAIVRASLAAHSLSQAAADTSIVAPEDAPRLLAPLLLVLVEAAALDPADPKMSSSLQVFADACHVLALPSLQRINLMSAVGIAVLPEMLQRLLPAVATAVAAQKRAGGAEQAADLALMHTNLRKLMTIMTIWVLDADKNAAGISPEHPITSEATAPLVAAFAQHGAAYVSTLEEGLHDFARLQSIAAPGFVWLSVLFVDEAAAATNTAAALASQSGEQLFSLLITALKAGMARVPASGIQAAMRSPTGEAAYEILGAVIRVLGAALAFKTSSSSSRRLWAVLLGRCLQAIGSALQQVQQASPGDNQSFLAEAVASMLQQCEEAAVWLLEELAAPEHALPGPVVQELRVLSNHVMEHIRKWLITASLQLLHDEQLPGAAAGSAAVAEDDQLPLQSPPAAQLGKLLKAFGAAVAAQLLVERCNFHGCSNAAKDSELELVGGKSCVCGDCKAARYCSRECQVAHYKRWHKAVCKRGQQ